MENIWPLINSTCVQSQVSLREVNITPASWKRSIRSVWVKCWVKDYSESVLAFI